MSSDSRQDAENMLDALVGETAGPEGTGNRRRRRRQDWAQPADFSDLPGNKQLLLQQKVAKDIGLEVPFFRCAEGLAKDTIRIDGRELINFSSYDYLGYNGTEPVNAAAIEALTRYGSSASASRIVSGQRPPHAELEKALAAFLGYPEALAFVSGYMTNVTVVSHLFGKNDLIAYDSLSHNSVVMGGQFSGAAHYAFPHNDIEALDRYLAENRGRYARTLLVTEGLFGMDGTIGRLPELVEVKRRHNAFLMVDEAHSLGVLGATGRGAAEHCGLSPDVIDINMGTLSKTLCGCGGYIAGSPELLHYLRFTVPGFLYSVGMPPPIAAAVRTALGLLERDPAPVARLRELGGYFLGRAREMGFNTGSAVGRGLVPLIVGNSLVAALLSSALFERGVNVFPIIYPVVPEGTARLRFFLTCLHREEQIDRALALAAEELPKAKQRADTVMERVGRGETD